MTTLSKDEVVKMAREAGYRADAKMHDHDYDLFLSFYTLCRAPLVAENTALKQAHEINADTLNAMQVEIDDWKARALKAEQAEPEWNDENVITYCIARGISSAKAFTIGATHPQATHPAPRTAGDIPEHVALVCEAYDFAQFSNVEQLNQLPVSVFNALHKVLEDLYRRTYTPPRPAAQEPTSAAPVVEPVAYIAWKDGKPCYEGDDAICEDAVWPVDSDDDRTSMPVFTAPQPAAQEGEAVAKVVLTKTLGLPTMQWLGLDKQFDLADGQLLYTTPQPAQPESIECDCGRIHKKTRYGWACSEPAQPSDMGIPISQPEQGPPT